MKIVSIGDHHTSRILAADAVVVSTKTAQNRVKFVARNCSPHISDECHNNNMNKINELT